jgi:hypothetical protein
VSGGDSTNSSIWDRSRLWPARVPAFFWAPRADLILPALARAELSPLAVFRELFPDPAGAFTFLDCVAFLRDAFAKCPRFLAKQRSLASHGEWTDGDRDAFARLGGRR